MCQVLAALLALLVFVQMVSCGMFFCVRLPSAGRSYAKYVDLTSEVAEALPAAHSAAAAAAAAAVAAQDTYSTPKLIPRIIHQTYHSQRLPRSIKHLTRSWREKNGDKWQVRFYDDAACLNFVRQEFPEYLEAYQFLPKDVERADFFR
jgi:mannosyltransferase OCH1-like enzyme